MLISSIYTNQLEKEKNPLEQNGQKIWTYGFKKEVFVGFKHIKKLSTSLIIKQKDKLELYKDYIFICEVGKDEKLITQSQHCWWEYKLLQ